MARDEVGEPLHAPGFPHPRGDGPVFVANVWLPPMISPPAWGWPEEDIVDERGPHDFPTRVGMARLEISEGTLSGGFPHPRGDGPGKNAKGRTAVTISPPAWGWPDMRHGLPLHWQDFPTRVGMARSRKA